MKRTAFFLVLVLLGARANTSAQNSPPHAGSISPAKILDGFLSATGGLNAHKELITLESSGLFGFSMYHPLGSYTFQYKAPENDVLEAQLISHGTSWTGHLDGHFRRRWTVEGAAMINGAGLETVEQCLVSLLEWDIRNYDKIEVIGRAQVDKKWAYAVRFTPKQGDPQVRYYDMKSFLMLRMDQVQRFRRAKGMPEIAYAIVTYFRDYQQFGALKLPREIAVSRDVGDLVFHVDHVKAGVDIPDSAFRD